MSKENNLTDFLTDVADAIREKKGTSEKINPQNFSEEIRRIGQAPEEEEEEGEPEYVESMTIDATEYESSKFVNEKAITVGTLTFKRNLNAGVWNPIYVPFEIPLSVLLDNYDVAYINDANAYDEDEDSDIDNFNVQTIKIVDSSKTLQAGYPYLIRPKNADYAQMTLVLNNGVVLKSTGVKNRKVVTCTSAYMKYEFKGVYESSDRNTLSEGNSESVCYGVTSKGTWGKMSATAKIPTFRLVLVITQLDGSPYVVDEKVFKG